MRERERKRETDRERQTDRETDSEDEEVRQALERKEDEGGQKR